MGPSGGLRATVWDRGVASSPRARRRLLIVVVALLVCAYALAVLGYVVVTPEIGVRWAFTPIVNHFYSQFLDPPDQAPLREGDTVVAVAGHPVENWSQILRRVEHLPDEAGAKAQATRTLLAEALAHERPPHRAERTHLLIDGRHVVRVDFRRPGDPDGAIRSVWLHVGPTPMVTLVPSVLWLLLKIGLFSVGVLVFWNRPSDGAAAQFFVLCVVSLGAFVGGYHWVRIVTQPVLLVVFMACSLLLPPVTLHFYLVFPRPKRVLERRPLRLLTLLYGPAVAFLLLMLWAYLRLQWLYPAGASDSPYPEAVGLTLKEILWEIYLYFPVAGLWYLASIVALVHSFFAASDAVERNQVKCILIGAAAALAPIGYSLYLAFFDPEKFGGGAATWPMFAASVCLTVAFTISITRYRLMQLDQLLSSGVVYFLLSFLAGLVYYALAFLGLFLVNSRGGEGPSLTQAFLVSSTALLLLTALDLMRRRLKSVLDRHFRREKHQLDRTWRRMSEAIEQLVDSPTLARRLLQTSAELLGAANGAVYLRQGDPPLYRLTHALGPVPELTELSPGCPLIEAVREQGSATAHLRLASDPARRQLLFLKGEMALGLLHEGELLGLLVLGPKGAGAYTPEDLNLLTAFAQITALALVSAEGHRTIDLLNRDLKTKVEKIAEQQRRILALQSQLRRPQGRRPSRNAAAANSPRRSRRDRPGRFQPAGPAACCICSGRWRRRRLRCCCAGSRERGAPARGCSPAPSTTTARGPASRSSRSTAPTWHPACSKANYLDTSRGRSPTPSATRRAGSRRPTAARCSWTRSATWPRKCKSSCCACSRK